jgi:ATP-dependent Clp protease ATP-binding subunit ClpA
MSASEVHMFERYSEKARRVIFFARYEASQFGSSGIETEHLLLGILRESRDLLLSVAPAAEVETIGEQIRAQVSSRGKIPTSVELPFRESSRRALTYACEEADRLESKTISVLHILLGLLREEACLAQRILVGMGVTLDAARRRATDWSDNGAAPHGRTLPVGFAAGAVPNEEFHRAVMDALDEANLLHSPSAGPEHLLLGLLRNESSLAARLLREAGLDLDSIRRKLGHADGRPTD